MKLVLAPNVMLETPVIDFDYDQINPIPIALKMIDLMNFHSGLGLAANQVRIPYKIFVMRPVINKKFGSQLVVMNPIIRGISQEQEIGIEGCLSHPNLMLKVRRPISCIVQFDSLSEDFKDIIRVDTKFDDIDARIFLHEYDHLQGIQFIDRVSKLKLQLAEKRRQKRNKNGG